MARVRRWRWPMVWAVSTLSVVTAVATAPAASAAPRQRTAASTATVTSSTTANLLTGDQAAFDSSTGGWVGSGATVSLVTSPTQSGLGALALTTTAAGPATVSATSGSGPATWTPGVPGQIYTGSAWAEAASTGRTTQAVLGFLSSTGQVLDTSWAQGTSDSTTGWTQTSQAVGIAPSGTAFVELVILVYGTAQGETHYVDTASLTTAPSGSASIAGPLHTSGNQIYDANNNPVVFRGIHRDGLERDITNLSSDEIGHAKQWGANFVRVPLGEQLWLSNSCAYDPTYASKVDNMVSWITSRGMVALLDLHYNTISNCGTASQQFMADYPNSTNFWKQVAARYKSNPLVAFDLYNEPHDISNTVWLKGGQVTQGSTTFQAAGMQQMYDAIRSQGAKNLVFASGNNWANTFVTTLSGYNVVYAVHDYTCPSAAPPACTTPNPYDPSPILNGWVTPSQSVPVMVTEFGWPNKNDGQYNANVISYAKSHGWGWDVFAWDGSTTGLFDLVAEVGSGTAYEPSPSGMPALTGFRANS